MMLQVKPSDRVLMETKNGVASLTVPSVSKLERGPWQVQLRNEGGMAEAKCNIIVLGRHIKIFLA